MVVALKETQHNSTAHGWCEVIAGVVAVAFLVGCLKVWRRCGVVDEGPEEVACFEKVALVALVALSQPLNWARGTPFNSRHTTKPEQAKLAQRYGDSLPDGPGGVACARRRGEQWNHKVYNVAIQRTPTLSAHPS